MKKFILISLLFLSTSAFAQQSSETQALNEKLVEEINSNLQCKTNLINEKKEIKRLQNEIEKLKEKDKKE